MSEFDIDTIINQTMIGPSLVSNKNSFLENSPSKTSFSDIYVYQDVRNGSKDTT